MQWLDRYALKAEARLDADPSLAERVYSRLAERLKENGTGTVLLFGTIKEDSNIILAQCMQRAGIRAFIGKLSMDIDITTPDATSPIYNETSPSASLAAAQSFIDRCRNLVVDLPEERRLIRPVLTPRFIPTCTEELLNGLAKISDDQDIKIQSHMAEAKDEVEWVLAERGKEDIDVFDQAGILTHRAVQAHCTFLSLPDLARVSSRGTSIAHCPLSNCYFSAKPFPLREAIDAGVKVGLGTDVAGGYSLDIMSAMRQAVAVSRMREGDRSMNHLQVANTAHSSSDIGLSIDWKEALYLATCGGALSLGLQGMFSVGAPFDAQEIVLYDVKTGRGVGSLDFFDLEAEYPQDSSLTRQTLTLEMVEKWWCIGDTRNRRRMWTQGQEVHVVDCP